MKCGELSRVILSRLYGTYTNSLDEKGRIAIPSKMRAALQEPNIDKLYLTRGIDTCITCYPYSEWIKFIDNLNKVNLDEKTKRKLHRQFIGNAAEIKFDSQGRLNIPTYLLSFAGLEGQKEAVVVGCGNVIEIWNQEKFSNGGEEDIIQETMGSISFSYTPENDGL